MTSWVYIFVVNEKSRKWVKIVCETCEFIKSVFIAARNEPHYNYMPVLMMLKEIEIQKRIELFAGDCPIEDVSYHLDRELHFTVRHYFKCKSCGQFLFVGACIRGTPIFKTLNSLENENFENVLWGKAGILFE